MEIRESGAIKHGVGSRYADASLSKIDWPTDVCSSIVKWTDNPECFLTISGPPGIGKTYMCAAIINAIHVKKQWVRYYKMDNLFSDLKSLIGENKDPEKRLEVISEADYLILDDLGIGNASSEWEIKMLNYLLELRYCEKRATLITTNMTKQAIKSRYSDRFFSRLCSSESEFITLNLPDRRNPKE